MSTSVSIKKYKQPLDEFRDHVSEFYGHRYVLNGHEPHWNPMAWMDPDLSSRSRGVSADLVLIFEDRSKVTERKPSPNRSNGRPLYDSIAFSFNQDEDDPNKMNVSFSEKKGDNIESSQFYPEAIFKEILKGVNRGFRENGVPSSKKELMGVLSAFWDNPGKGIAPINTKKEVKDIIADYEEKVPAMKKRIQHLNKDVTSNFLKASDLKKKIEKDIKDCEESREIDELEKRIRQLRKAKKERKNRLLDERGVTDLEKKIGNSEREISKLNNSIHACCKNALKKAPNSVPVMSAIKDWFHKYM